MLKGNGSRICILATLIGLLFFIFTSAEKESRASNSIILSINKNLEVVGSSMRSGNYKVACKEANIASKKILKNRSELVKQEPYYDWDEIDKVLNSLIRTHC